MSYRTYVCKIRMRLSSCASVMIIALSAISTCHSQSYAILEALDVNCPAKDRCRGYRNNLTYMDRSCECDRNCTAYKDCCIDALETANTEMSRPPARTDVTCMHYGEFEHAGVYVINKCSSSWNGSRKVTEKCEGSDDFSDPLSAAPVTDVAQKKTYRNLACARCNNADLEPLKTFGLRLLCPGLDDAINEIVEDLTYNQERQLWGVNRLNRFGNGTEFYGCTIVYDVQGYLNSSVRFCRSNVISTCASDWTLRPGVATLCAQYMTVVYSNTHAYRNPHCAICNHLSLAEISCDKLDNISRSPKPFSFTHMLDFNRDDGEVVGMQMVSTPACPSDHIYDSFLKTCRKLVCALPGYLFIDGRCQKG